MRSILAVSLALFILSPAFGQTRRKVTILEETEPAPAPAPTVIERRIYIQDAPAPRRVTIQADPCQSSAATEFSTGPLGIRSSVRYANGVEVRYGLFGRVRSIRQR